MKQSSFRISEIEVSYLPATGRRPVVKSSFEAYSELKTFFPITTIALQERFNVMYLNRANRVIGVYEHSMGGITGTVADPRIILSVALKVLATGIILSHNHPSGNLQPSVEDKNLTNRFQEACKFLEIKLTDHIILSPEGGYYSFADEGLM